MSGYEYSDIQSSLYSLRGSNIIDSPGNGKALGGLRGFMAMCDCMAGGFSCSYDWIAYGSTRISIEPERVD